VEKERERHATWLELLYEYSYERISCFRQKNIMTSIQAKLRDSIHIYPTIGTTPASRDLQQSEERE